MRQLLENRLLMRNGIYLETEIHPTFEDWLINQIVDANLHNGKINPEYIDELMDIFVKESAKHYGNTPYFNVHSVLDYLRSFT